MQTGSWYGYDGANSLRKRAVPTGGGVSGVQDGIGAYRWESRHFGRMRGGGGGGRREGKEVTKRKESGIDNRHVQSTRRNSAMAISNCSVGIASLKGVVFHCDFSCILQC